MCRSISIDTLLGNYFMLKLKNESKERFLSYAQLYLFRDALLEELKKKNQEAVFVLNRKSLSQVYSRYPSFFRESRVDGQSGVALDESVQLKSLQTAFLGLTPSDLYNAELSVFGN